MRSHFARTCLLARVLDIRAGVAKDCSQLGTNCTLAEAQEQCVVEPKPAQRMQRRSQPYSQYQCNNRPAESGHPPCGWSVLRGQRGHLWHPARLLLL